MPVVYLDDERRGAACAEALTAAALVGEELGVPVFLYGELATRPEHAERAWHPRAAARSELARRIEAGELVPDYGPRRAHPTAGRSARRGAAAACCVQRGPRDATTSSSPRRSPPSCASPSGGLPGVRALGLYLDDRGARRSRRTSTTTARCRCARSSSACASAREVAEAELIGLAPRAAFEGFPEDVPLRGFDSRAPHPRGGARGPSGNVDPPDGPDQAQAHPQAPRHPRRDDRARGPDRPPPDARGRQADRAPAARRAPRQAADLAERRSTARRSPRRCSACCWWCSSSKPDVRRASLLAALHVPALHPARLRHRHDDLPLPPARRRPRRLADGRAHVHGRPRGREHLHLPARRLGPRPDRRPRRRGGQAARRDRRARRQARRHPPHAHALRPRRRRGRRSPGRRAPRSGSRRSRRSCSTTSTASCPGRGSARSSPTRPSTRSSGGERLELAGFEIDVLFTPGHSPGHVTFSIPDEQAIFSGDVLFQQSVGRTDLPGGDHGTLLESIRDAGRHAPGGDRRLPRPHGPHEPRRRAGEQPVPRRAGEVSGKLQAPRGTLDVQPADARRRLRLLRDGRARCSGAPATSRSRRRSSRTPSCSRAGWGSRPTSSRRRCSPSRTRPAAR